MKRNFYLLLPFLLVVLLLVACGGAGTANNEPAGDTNQVGNSAGEEVVNDNNEEPAGEAVVPTGYKEYENPTNGLSLAYPNDWSILEDAGNSLTLGSHAEMAAGAIPDEPYALYLLNVSGRGMVGLPEAATGADIAAHLSDRFSSLGLPAGSITAPPEATSLNDHPAAIGTIVLDQGNGVEVANTFLMFTENDRLVTVISVISPAGSVEEFAPAVGQINRSIRVQEVNLALVEGATVEEGLDAGHDSNVVYDNTGLPPIGGIHDPFWQNCGIYDEPVGDKHAVHSLEHGAVWITYQPDLDENAVEHLRDLARGEDYVLLSPYPNLQSPVVLTAWGVQLELDDAMDERVQAFIDIYQAGPQTPEPGASCQRGVGQPLE